MLVTAALLGADFSLATLVAVAGDVDVVAGVEQAVRAGLVTEEPDPVDHFSFTHALVRETLYERPIVSRRVRIHRALAEALEAAPLDVPPAELAHHYFVARQVGGAERRSAMRSERLSCQAAHAYEEAAAHYERALVALDLARPDDRVARADLLLALGRARWQASERGRASRSRSPPSWRATGAPNASLGRRSVPVGATTLPASPTRRTSRCSRRRSRRSSPTTAPFVPGCSPGSPSSWRSSSDRPGDLIAGEALAWRAGSASPPRWRPRS